MSPAYDNPEGLDPDATCYYVSLGDGEYQPTLHTQGAWQPHEQHMAPVAGLLAHVMERTDPRADMQLAQFSFDILGMIPARRSTVTARVVRPGRTIELLEATMSVEGKDVVRCLAWRLQRQDTAAIAGGFWEDGPEAIPGREQMPAWAGSEVWGGGYIASLDFRSEAGHAPGRGRAWVGSKVALVDAEPVSDLARYVGLIDTANGVATRAHPAEWLYPNLDLTIHLFRSPAAGWVGLDTEVVFGEQGVGLTSSRLYDVFGAVGRCEQILTVRPSPS